MNEITTTRTLEVIGAEIRTFTASMLNNIIEIGRRMCEAKELLGHGEFMPWIEEATGYSQSTANNFMRLFQEYGERQGSLFGAELSNSQTFGNLTYSKALALLALPSAEEREAFVEAHNVDEMTTRELKEAIRERDEAKKALQTTTARLEDTQRTLTESGALNTELQQKLAQARADLTAADSEAEKNERQLKERIKELEERPVDVAVQVDEEAVKKAAEEARAAAEQEWSEKLKAAEDKLKKAEEKAKKAAEKAKAAGEDAEKESSAELEAAKAEAEKAKAEAESLRKQLAMSSETVTRFKVHFSAWQRAYQEMTTALASADEETAKKLHAAIAAQIDAWKDGAA